MKPIYELSPNGQPFNIKDHFPKLEKNKRMGVFLSGGMESTLITLIAQEVYGKENVLIFYSDNIFSANDPKRSSYIIANVLRTSEFLNLKFIFDFFRFFSISSPFLNCYNVFSSEVYLFLNLSQNYNLLYFLRFCLLFYHDRQIITIALITSYIIK